jgi:hypothetical protein
MCKKLLSIATLATGIAMCASIVAKGDEPGNTKKNTAIEMGLMMFFEPQLLDKRINPPPMPKTIPVPKLPLPSPPATATPVATGTVEKAFAAIPNLGNWIVHDGKWALRVGGKWALRVCRTTLWTILICEAGKWIYENGEWLWETNKPSTEPPPSDELPITTRGALLARTPYDPKIRERMTTEFPWEQIIPESIDEKTLQVALRFHTGYLTSDPVNNTVSATAKNRGDWELFQIKHNDDGTISLLAGANGKYICAQNGGGGKLTVDAVQIGDWEKFTPIKADGKLYLVTSGGFYLCAEGGP